MRKLLKRHADNANPPTHTEYLQRDDYHKYLLLLVREDVFDKSPAGADQSQSDEEESALQPESHKSTNMSNKCITNASIQHSLLLQQHSQVSYVVHDSPAFNRIALSVDEVIVDLREGDQRKSETTEKDRILK